MHGEAAGQRALAAAALHGGYRDDHVPHPHGLAKKPRQANQHAERYRIRGKLPIAASV
jgi:hypothetical protein